MADPGPALTYFCDGERHLVCQPYSLPNLHVMAGRLGLKRHWYHGGRSPHYDIPKRRREEIMGKCVVLTTREILALIKDARGG